MTQVPGHHGMARFLSHRKEQEMDRTVLRLAADTYDTDEFGWVQGWRFAICDYLTDLGEAVPDFRQGPFGSDTEAVEYDWLEDEQPSTESLWHALRVLNRYRNLLALAGEDY